MKAYILGGLCPRTSLYGVLRSCTTKRVSEKRQEGKEGTRKYLRMLDSNLGHRANLLLRHRGLVRGYARYLCNELLLTVPAHLLRRQRTFIEGRWAGDSESATIPASVQTTVTPTMPTLLPFFPLFKAS